MAKRYYWLKLKDDYLDSPKIKKLRKIAGGDTYTIIYLKMQLLSESGIWKNRTGRDGHIYERTSVKWRKSSDPNA